MRLGRLGGRMSRRDPAALHRSFASDQLSPDVRPKPEHGHRREPGSDTHRAGARRRRARHRGLCRAPLPPFGNRRSNRGQCACMAGACRWWTSLRLVVATIVSNASGASVGMEAGYSQFGASAFSSVGQYFKLRRADRRVFVTAGAAAAIAAAFNAPLAGRSTVMSSSLETIPRAPLPPSRSLRWPPF